MMKLEYSRQARRDLRKLPKEVSLRIGQKLRWFAGQEDPLVFAKRVYYPTDMIFRFRIGDYRAVFRLEGKTLEVIFILTVKHRSVSYRDLNVVISYTPPPLISDQSEG